MQLAKGVIFEGVAITGIAVLIAWASKRISCWASLWSRSWKKLSHSVAVMSIVCIMNGSTSRFVISLCTPSCSSVFAWCIASIFAFSQVLVALSAVWGVT